MQVATCPHGPPYVRKSCPHLLVEPDIPERVRFFSGVGIEYQWRCPACADAEDPALAKICAACERRIEPGAGDQVPYRGKPGILERRSPLHFEHVDLSLSTPLPGDLVGITPIEAEPNHWLGLCRRGQLVHIDFSNRSWQPVLTLDRTPEGVMFGEEGYPEAVAMHLRLAASEPASSKRSGVPASQRLVMRDRATRLPVLLAASTTGRFLAVCNRWGERGVALDIQNPSQSLDLKRNYHAEQTDFPAAFAESSTGAVLVHGTAWNRLDVTEMTTLRLLSERDTPVGEEGKPLPEHYLDYFHGGLLVSPDNGWILDNGWVWHPVGVVTTWNLKWWLDRNVWESEDGPSRRWLCTRDYLWDAPVTWINDGTVAVWGFGEDDEWMLDAARIYDVQTGEQQRWFAGPAGNFAFDRYLFSFGESLGTSVWDIQTGERLLRDEEARPVAFQRSASSFLSIRNGVFRISRLVDQT